MRAKFMLSLSTALFLFVIFIQCSGQILDERSATVTIKQGGQSEVVKASTIDVNGTFDEPLAGITYNSTDTEDNNENKTDRIDNNDNSSKSQRAFLDHTTTDGHPVRSFDGHEPYLPLELAVPSTESLADLTTEGTAFFAGNDTITDTSTKPTADNTWNTSDQVATRLFTLKANSSVPQSEVDGRDDQTIFSQNKSRESLSKIPFENQDVVVQFLATAAAAAASKRLPSGIGLGHQTTLHARRDSKKISEKASQANKEFQLDLSTHQLTPTADILKYLDKKSLILRHHDPSIPISQEKLILGVVDDNKYLLYKPMLKNKQGSESTAADKPELEKIQEFESTTVDPTTEPHSSSFAAEYQTVKRTALLQDQPTPLEKAPDLGQFSPFEAIRLEGNLPVPTFAGFQSSPPSIQPSYVRPAFPSRLVRPSLLDQGYEGSVRPRLSPLDNRAREGHPVIQPNRFSQAWTDDNSLNFVNQQIPNQQSVDRTFPLWTDPKDFSDNREPVSVFPLWVNTVRSPQTNTWNNSQVGSVPVLFPPKTSQQSQYQIDRGDNTGEFEPNYNSINPYDRRNGQNTVSPTASPIDRQRNNVQQIPPQPRSRRLYNLLPLRQDTVQTVEYPADVFTDFESDTYYPPYTFDNQILTALTPFPATVDSLRDLFPFPNNTSNITGPLTTRPTFDSDSLPTHNVRPARQLFQYGIPAVDQSLLPFAADANLIDALLPFSTWPNIIQTDPSLYESTQFVDETRDTVSPWDLDTSREPCRGIQRYDTQTDDAMADFFPIYDVQYSNLVDGDAIPLRNQFIYDGLPSQYFPKPGGSPGLYPPVGIQPPLTPHSLYGYLQYLSNTRVNARPSDTSSDLHTYGQFFRTPLTVPQSNSRPSYNLDNAPVSLDEVSYVPSLQRYQYHPNPTTYSASIAARAEKSTSSKNVRNRHSPSIKSEHERKQWYDLVDNKKSTSNQPHNSDKSSHKQNAFLHKTENKGIETDHAAPRFHPDIVSDKRSPAMSHLETDVEWPVTAAKTSTHEGRHFIKDQQLFPYEPENNRHTETPEYRNPRILLPYEPERHFDTDSETTKLPFNQGQRPLFPYEPENNLKKGNEALESSHDKEPLFPYQPENYHDTLSDTIKSSDTQPQRPLFPYEPEHNWDRNIDTSRSFPHQRQRPLFPYEPEYNRDGDRLTSHSLDLRPLYPYEPENNRNKLEQSQTDGRKQGHSGRYRERYLNNQIAIQLYPHEPENILNKNIHSTVGQKISASHSNQRPLFPYEPEHRQTQTPTPPTHHSQISLFPYEPENNQDRPLVSPLQNSHQQGSYADRFLETAVSKSHQERRPFFPYEPQTNMWNGKPESKDSQRYAQRLLFPYEPENYRGDEIHNEGGPANHNANMPDGRHNQRSLFPYEPENNLGIRQLYDNPLFPYEPENNRPRITSSTSQSSPGSYIDHYLKTTESSQNQKERSLFPYEPENSYGKRIDSISPGQNEKKKSLFPYQPGHTINDNNNVFLDNKGFQQEHQRSFYPYQPEHKPYENEDANQQHSPQIETSTLFPYEPPNSARLMGTASPPQDHGPRPPFPYEPTDSWGGAEAAHSQSQQDHQGSYRDRYLKETRISTEHQAQRSLFPYEPESNLNPTTHVQLSNQQQQPNHQPILFPYESENNRGRIENFQQNEAKENYQPQLFPYEPENHRRTATEPGSHGQSQKPRQLFPYEPENNPERYRKWQENAEDLNQRPLSPYEPENNEGRKSAPTNHQQERESLFPYGSENNHETNAEHGGQQRQLFPYEPENNFYRNEQFDSWRGEMSIRQRNGDINKRQIFPYEKDDHKPSPYSAIHQPSIDSYSGDHIVNTLLSNGHKIKNDFGIPASIFSSHAASADHPPRKESKSRPLKRLEDLIKRPFDLTELLSYNGVPLINSLRGEKGFHGSQDSGKYSHTRVRATPWEPPVIAPRIGNIHLTSDLYDVIESQRQMLLWETLDGKNSADSPVQGKTPEDQGDSVLRKDLEDTRMDKEHAATDKLSLLKNFMPVNKYDTDDHAHSVSTDHSRETNEKDNGKAIKKNKEHKTDAHSSIKTKGRNTEELYGENGSAKTQASSNKSHEKIMRNTKHNEKTIKQKSSSQVLPWGFIRPQPDPDYRPYSFSGNSAWSDPNFHNAPWQLVRAPVMSNLSPIRTHHISTSTADQTIDADDNDDSAKSHANLQEQEEDAIAANDSQRPHSEPQIGLEDNPSDAAPSGPNFDQHKGDIVDNHSAMQHSGPKIKQKLEAVQTSPDKSDLDRNVTFLRDNNRTNSDQDSKINETNVTDAVLKPYTNHVDNESITTDMKNNNYYDNNDGKHDNSNSSNNSDINSNRTSHNLADISSDSNNDKRKDINITSDEPVHTDIQEPPALPHNRTPSPTSSNQINSVDENLLFDMPPDADVLNNLPHPSNNQINSPTLSDNLPSSSQESGANLSQDSMHIDDHQSSSENQPSRAHFDAPAGSNVLDGVNTEGDEYSSWLTSSTRNRENGQRLQRSVRDVNRLDPPNSVAQLSRDSDKVGGQDYTVHAWNYPLGGKTWLRDFTNPDELSSTSEPDVNREAGQDSQVLSYADRFLLDKKLKAEQSTTNQHTDIRRSTITRSNFTPTQNGNVVIPSPRGQTPVNPYGQSILTPKGYYDPQTGGYFVDQVADTSQISTTDSRLPSFDSYSQFYSSDRAEDRDIPNTNTDRDDFRPPTNSGPPDFGVLTNNNSRYLNNGQNVEYSNVKSPNTNTESNDSSNDLRSSDRRSPDYVIINSQNTESPETTNMKLVYNTDMRNYNSKQGGYTSTQGGYSSNQGGYSSNQGGYNSNQGGYRSNQRGYSSNQGGYSSNQGGYSSNQGGYSSTQGDNTHFSNQGYNQRSYTSNQGQEPFRTKTVQSNLAPYSGVKQTHTLPSYNSQYSSKNSVQSYSVPQSQYNIPQTKNYQSQLHPNVPFSPVGYLSYYFTSPYAYVTDPRLVSSGFQQQIDLPQYAHGGSGTITSRSSPHLKTKSYYILQNGVQKGVYTPWYNSANNNRFSNSAKFRNRINLDEDARDMQAILEFIYARGKFDSKNPGNYGSNYGYSGYKKGYSYPMKYGNSLGHVAYGYNHGSNLGNIYQGYNNRHSTGHYSGIGNGFQTGSNRLIVSQNRNFIRNQRKTYGDFSRNYNPAYFKNTKLSRLPSVNRGYKGVNSGLARSGYDRDMQAIEHFVYSHPKFGKGQSSKGFGGLF